jgi:toxin HigB-1
VVTGSETAASGWQASQAHLSSPAMTIYYSPRFQRSYKHLDPQIQKASEKRVALFRNDPLDQRLGTHRLHGKLKAYWSFAIDTRHRILFEFIDAKRQEVVFLDIGDHALYQ